MAYKETKNIFNSWGVDGKKKFPSFCHVELFLPLRRVFLNLVMLTVRPSPQNPDSHLHPSTHWPPSILLLL